MTSVAPKTRVPFVDLRAQYAAIRDEIDGALHAVIERGAFILGEEVAAFERAFASFCGAREAVGVGNGTDALVLALKAVGVRAGDEVITAANTFVATAEAIVHAGAAPVLVDAAPLTYTLDPTRLEAAITPRTRAIIPVHLYGQAADMDPLTEIAHRHGLAVIEDASQAHGAAYRGRRVGGLGDAACFSFYPSKNLGAYGDAGAVVTNDAGVALRLRRLRDHGGLTHYQHEIIGHNSRMDALQWAVLTVKLRHLEEWNRLRGEHAQLYTRLLANLPGVVTPAIGDGCTHVFHLYVIALVSGDRDALRTYLLDRGVQTGIHYPAPVHLTEAFRGLGYPIGTFPVAEQAARQIVSLPMFPELSPDAVAHVVGAISEFLMERGGRA
jgi:dTDP-4-amino-4,6-dideoxygalactose transaminase